MAMTSAERAAQWQSARISSRPRPRTGRLDRTARRLRVVRGRAGVALARFRRTALVLGGVGSLVAAVFCAWGLAPGLASLGVAFFAVEYLTGEGA